MKKHLLFKIRVYHLGKILLILMPMLLFGSSQLFSQSDFFKNGQRSIVLTELDNQNNSTEITTTFQKISDYDVLANIIYRSVGDANPIEFEYSYNVTEHHKGSQVEMLTFLNYLDLYLDDNVVLEYKGDFPLIPFSEETTSRNYSGIYTLVFSDNPEFLFQYSIELNELEFIGTEDINIGGQIFTADKISYKLNVDKNVNGDVIEKQLQNSIDWFIPNVGVIKRDRNIEISPTGEAKKTNYEYTQTLK